MALQGATDHDKLLNLEALSYKEQGIWFLNAYWDQFASNEAERVFEYVKKCAELDLQSHGAGSGLDEVNAHRFLELLGETLTVMAMRDKLRSTGAVAPTERPKVVPLTHYLLFKYAAQVDWHYLVNTAGDNSEEIAEAQRLLDQVIALFAEAERRAKVARQREAEARAAEAPFKAAQEEVDAALAEVKAQEAEFNNRTAQLTAASKGPALVAANKAKNELAQHLASDPLPLRKAKITLEAALKRAEKARAPFEAARKIAEEARAAADEALDEASAKVQEAEAYLEEVKNKPGTPHGAIWWIERELHEQKQYLPSSRGGIAKKK